MKIDIASSFSFGFNRLQANPIYYIVGGLILGALSACLGGISFAIIMAMQVVSNKIISNMPEALQQLSSLILSSIYSGISMLLGIAIAPFIVGFFKGIKKEYEGGRAELGDIFSGLAILIPSILNYAVVNILLWLASMCCYFPVLLVSPLLPLTLYYLANGKTSGFEAFKKAIDTLMANPILILWSFLIGLFASAGILLCCVGILVTVPISAAIAYSVCAQASGEDNNNTESIEVKPEEIKS